MPETRYAKTADGLHIAYQELGNGPVDFVYIAPWFSHIEYRWELPRYASYLERLASFSRLILFDRRGMGMSDPVPASELPDLETQLDDVRAVMDAANSERAVIYGASETGAIAVLFAATYPRRTRALVIHGSYPSSKKDADAPWGITPETFAADLEAMERSWGTEGYVLDQFPSMQGDDALVRFIAAYMRHAMSPGAAMSGTRMEYETDVRNILPAIAVPTLILHREEDGPQSNRYLVEHIPGSRFIELPGKEHVPYLGDQDSVVEAIETFVRGVRDEEAELSRELCTVLFTDIVDSTTQAA